MAFGGDEEAVWILRIDENRRDLAGRLAKVLHVRPGFTRVGGFIDSVAGGEIRALQSFAAADINNVRIGRGDGESADGAGGPDRRKMGFQVLPKSVFFQTPPLTAAM